MSRYYKLTWHLAVIPWTVFSSSKNKCSFKLYLAVMEVGLIVSVWVCGWREGYSPFRRAEFAFFRTAIMVPLLRQNSLAEDLLKMSVKISFSCSTQAFSTRLVMLSSPAALCGLSLAKGLFHLVCWEQKCLVTGVGQKYTYPEQYH